MLQSSYLIIDDTVEQMKKKIKMENGLICDDKLDISLDTSNQKNEIISNGSSILQSSSSLEQDAVIYKKNCVDVLHIKENADNNIILLNDKSIELKTDVNSVSCEEKTNAKKQINISNSVSNDILEINKSRLLAAMKRKKRYATRFQPEDFIEKSSQLETVLTEENTTVFRLEPDIELGHSVSIDGSFMGMNETITFTKGRKWSYTVDDMLPQQSLSTSIHQNLDQSNILKNSMCSSNQRYSHTTSTDLENQRARRYIFDICQQQELISFESWLSLKCTNKWKKVGEGVYGEVFSYLSGNQSTIVKIIPIEGEVTINNEKQKKMFEVYSEILIATELNKLCKKKKNFQTSSFCKVKRVSCVQGKYPSILIDYWQQYDKDKGSDNDNPEMLPINQIFIILELNNGGIDVEHFIFKSADQSLFAFLQIVFGLAVAEGAFMFEHRDLHIGNILMKKYSNKKIAYSLEGEHFNVPSRNVKVTIIDYTLSRMTYNSNHIYNDLTEDTELFTSVGNYQFDIYRMMKKETNDQWESFKPATNIYWLHYVLDKILTSVNYKQINTTVHNIGLSNLERLKSVILSYDSAKSFAKSELILDLIAE